MALFPELTPLFQSGIRDCDELLAEALSERSQLLGRPSWDRFGSDMACLSSLFEVALDRREADLKHLGDFFPWHALIHCCHNSLSQFLRVGFHTGSLSHGLTFLQSAVVHLEE